MPVFQTELQDKQVKEGDNLTLDVRVPAECMAQVTWYKDDHALKEDHHIAIINAGEMHAVNIFNVSVKDEAVFRCVATNDAGTIHTNCEVLVEGTRQLVPSRKETRASSLRARLFLARVISPALHTQAIWQFVTKPQFSSLDDFLCVYIR